MSNDKLRINDNLPYGATKLSPDELEGLIPSYISTRAELNEFEKRNIMDAFIWLGKTKPKYTEILTLDFCIKLHIKMFVKTWKWAGTFRQREVNIGNISPEQIQIRLRNILDDARFWIENETYPVDEICLRVHRAIVWVHPFPNGNGRHIRIICDELRRTLGYSYFTWGNSGRNLINSSQIRHDYIQALRQADIGDFNLLISFANSR